MIIGFEASPKANRTTRAENARLADVPDVSTEREKQKQGAKKALPFRNPRDALNIKGMQRKQSGHDKAAPQKPGSATQQKKQQQDVHCVKKKAGGMVPPWMQPEELDVGHMRDPAERMPVAM